MRDDFSHVIIGELAKRVCHRCSNPECGRPTSGPRDDPARSVNIGVAAHITAAAQGGPRFDESLTSEERGSISNGIWLCQNCAKLIDNDPERFDALLLHRWKAIAEERARTEIERPTLTVHRGPTLHVPDAMNAASWLSYFSESTSFLGRSHELRLLKSFLQTDDRFRWWIITGSAGAGKSRLAFEICKAVSDSWDAGFLSRAEPFVDWAEWRPLRPTLIVVDYVAGRARSASDIALQLARASAALPAPVRLLLIERESTGSWWQTFMRADSHSESVDMAASQYAFPIQLEPMTDDEIWFLMAEVRNLLGLEWSNADREEARESAWHVDTLGLPLFAMIAAAVPPHLVSQETRTSILRSLLDREEARWESIIPDPGARERVLNLLVLVTILGGFDLYEGFSAIGTMPDVAPLLPDPYAFDEERYSEFAGVHAGPSHLSSMQPDLMGEFLVLEQLRGKYGHRMSTRRLLAVAWDLDPEAASQFVRRAVADFPSDREVAILQEPADRTAHQRKVWSQLVADLVATQGSSGNAQGKRNLEAIGELTLKYPTEIELRENQAAAIFNLGSLLLAERQFEAADEQLSLAIQLASPGSNTQANALNNRGVSRLIYRSVPEAFEDWSAVIVLPGASDEVRACAFNNRADVLSDGGRLEESIEGRSRVLELKETSYNRRFIAYFRRSVDYLRLGRTDEAIADLSAILDADDILIEQKMQARVLRARVLQRQEHGASVLADLNDVIRSPINFDDTVPQAHVLRGRAHLRAGAGESALEDFMSALSQDDASKRTIAEAYLGCGEALVSLGRVNEAIEPLMAARDHPYAGDDVSSDAASLLLTLGIE